MSHKGQSVNIFSVYQNGNFDKVTFFISCKFVIKAGISLGNRFQPVIKVKNNFIQISANSSGTYSIQALISAISTEKEDKILRELIQHNLLLMFTNENAHHVIQKIIIEFSEERRKYINDCIFEKIDKICVNE